MNTQKEQYNIIKEQAMAYKKSIYNDYPQVKKFEKIKSILIKYLLVLFLVISILHINNLYKVTGGNILLIAMAALIKIDWIFLLAALAPRWKFSLLLYILFFDKVFEFLSSLSSANISSFSDYFQIYITALQQYPLAAITDFLIIIYLLSIAFIAIWLTLFPKNRELARQSEELIGKVKTFISTKSS